VALDYDDVLFGGGGVGLPRCSYVDTDFFGDDVGDGRGISTGSAFACKQVGRRLL
jgi:hypothetical protein